MKDLFLAVFVLASPVAMATQMEGFGANYYQDESSVPSYNTNLDLAPQVIVGGSLFVMEFSRLADITKITGVTVNQGEKASWLCLTSKDINYWFISDNEMGQGYLTSLAVARTGQQKDCSSYNGDLGVTVRGVPLLNASLENLSTTFPNKPDGNIIQYCNDTKSYGDFTQMNCLQYYLENNNVEGIFISQITSN